MLKFFSPRGSLIQISILPYEYLPGWPELNEVNGKSNQVMFIAYCLYNKEKNGLNTLLLTVHSFPEGLIFGKSVLNLIGLFKDSPQGPWFKSSYLGYLVI